MAHSEHIFIDSPQRTIALKTKTVPVFYADEQLLIVGKPPGLQVCDAVRGERDLLQLLNESERESGCGRIYAAHRLDRDTSGVLVCCFGSETQTRIMELFKRRQVEKIYIGICQGALRPDSGQWRTQMRGAWPYTQAAPKLAVSRYRVLFRQPLLSVVALRPETGRKNQLRIHLQQAGHPLVGDRRFSVAREWAVPFPRTALHAWRLSLNHPDKKFRITVEAELPEDMQNVLSQHKVKWPQLRTQGRRC